MDYFVTGATGFIGKRLVRKLLARPDSTVHFLTRSSELEKLESLYAFWGGERSRTLPVVGDLKQPHLGVAKAELKRLKGKIDHVDGQTFRFVLQFDLPSPAH